MIEHTHYESKSCSCYTGALEPNDNCPIHGYPLERCSYCGQFMKKVRASPSGDGNDLQNR